MLHAAQENHFCQRQRSIDPVHLLDTLLEVLSSHKSIDVTVLHRHYVSKHRYVSYSSFYEQLSKPECVLWLKHLLNLALGILQANIWERLSTLWQYFDDVRIHDGSSWAVRDNLKDILPGRFKTIAPAAIELHATFSLLKGQLCQAQLAPDTVSEHHFFPTAYPNFLYLFDAGFVNLPALKRFEKAGAYFLARGKKGLNPFVIHDWNNGPVNQSLKSLSLKSRQNYDFQVSQKGVEYRLILLWNPQTKTHVAFLTNVPVEWLSKKALGKVYRLRWQIELLFKELKSFSGLKRLLTGNKQIVEGLVYVSLLACTLRRFLVLSAQKDKPLSTLKAGRSSASFLPEFLRCWRKKGAEAFNSLNTYLRRVMTISAPHKRHAFTPFGNGKVLS